MATSLTASFVLKLEDKLSSGIAALSKKLEALAALSQKLKFEGLQQAGGAFDKVGAAADSASRKVEGIGRSARSAVAELRRLSSQPIMINTGGTAFLPPSMARAGMAAVVAAAAAASGGGGGRAMLPSPSASFFSTPMLQLAGPGVGGIPLSFNPAVSQLSSLVGLAGQFRSAMGQAAGHVNSLNHNLREAGHGAIAAFATGFGLMHPIGEFADYEDRVRHISITQGTPLAQLPGAISGHMQEYNALGLQARQSSKEIADAAMFLLTDGLSKETVKAILPPIAMAATAYRGSVTDGVAAAFTMHQNLKVPEHDMGQAIAMMALAGRSGHVTFADQSRLLQGLAPAAERAGMSGLGGSAKLLAMLEAVKRGGAGTSDQAAIMLKDLIDYLNSPFGAHSFAKGGINLPKMMVDAEAKGINPVEAIMEAISRHTRGMTRQQRANYLGTVMHNSEARQGLAALQNQLDYYQEVEKKLRAANPNTIGEDFEKADGPEAKLRLLTEKLAQIVRRFGEGFAGLLDPMNAVLDKVLALFDFIDKRSPGTVNKVLGIGGGFLALVTTLGVLLPLFRAMQAGVMLLLSPIQLLITAVTALGRALLLFVVEGGPIVWAIAAIAAAAYLIYRNWDTLGPYFRQLWADLKIIFNAFWTWLSGWAGPTMTAVVNALKAAWNGLKTFFDQLWAYITAPFDHFMDRLRSGIDEMRKMLGGGSAATDGKPGDGQRDKNATDPDGKPALGGIPGFREMLKDAPFASPSSFRSNGPVTFAPLEIKVTTDGNAKVQAPQRIEPVNRGPMLDRA